MINKIKFIITTCLFVKLLFLNGLSFSQNASIKGIIKEAESVETLPGVNVVSNDSLGTVTDINGSYSLNLYSGINHISFSFVGYKTIDKEIDIKDGQELTLNISLETESELLDEIVVSAGKYAQKLSDISVSAMLLKPEKVVGTNIYSLESALDYLPGVDISDDQPSIRGGSGYSYGAGSRVLMLVDDLPMIAADAGDIKWDFLPAENIGQVEVLKGASSVMYGSSALNGVINLRTAYPKMKPTTKVDVYSGIYMNPKRTELIWWGNTQPTFSGMNLSHTRKIGKLDLVTGGHLFTDSGYREYDNSEKARFSLNLKYNDTERRGISYGLNSNMMYIDKIDFFLWQNADSGAFRQNADAVNRMEAYRINVDPFITYYTAAGNKHSLRTRYFRTSNYFKESQDKNSDANFYYGEYQYQRHNEIGRYKGTTTAGVVGTFSQILAKLYGDHTSNNLAAYAQYDLKFGKLSYSAGIRGEYFRVDTSVTRVEFPNITLFYKPVVRTGLSYQLAKHSFLRASYGQGYRFPAVAEKYTATNLSSLNIIPNPDLKPETGWSAELGIKQGLKLSGWKGYLDCAVFLTEYQDMIEYTFGTYKPDSVEYATMDHVGFKSLNIGNAFIGGVDVALTGEGEILGVFTELMAGYTFILPIDLNEYNKDTTGSPLQNEDNFLKYRYKHSVKADLSFRFSRFSTGIACIYRSFMINVDQALEEPLIPGVESTAILPGLREYREENNKGATVFDWRISYQLTERSTFIFHVKNLFNAEYMRRPADIGSPRTMMLQYSLSFK